MSLCLLFSLLFVMTVLRLSVPVSLGPVWRGSARGDPPLGDFGPTHLIRSGDGWARTSTQSSHGQIVHVGSIARNEVRWQMPTRAYYFGSTVPIGHSRGPEADREGTACRASSSDGMEGIPLAFAAFAGAPVGAWSPALPPRVGDQFLHWGSLLRRPRRDQSAVCAFVLWVLPWT